MFKNNFFFRSQSSFISGVKTICHQYFTIPLPAYKHLMIIVNTLHQILDNSVKIAAENSYSVLSLMIRRISHTSLFTNVTKILKKFSKIKNHMYTLHKPVFIAKYFSNKLTKTPLRGQLLIT